MQKQKKNVMDAVKNLGKDYKGQIGYFQVNPDTGEFKPKAGNYKMSFAGIEGENKIFKVYHVYGLIACLQNRTSLN